MTFTTHGYCSRRLFDEGTCYWHSQDANKYAAASVASYFESGTSLKGAIEAEVAAQRSLELAYLVKAPLGGSLLGPGCSLRRGIFVRANFTDAHLSYSDLGMADFSFANLEGAYLSDCNIEGVRFVGAKLFNTKFRRNNFATAHGLSKENFKSSRWGWLPMYRMLEEHPSKPVRPIGRWLRTFRRKVYSMTPVGPRFGRVS